MSEANTQEVSHEHVERVRYGAPTEEHVIRQPIALYYSLLVGGALATLGILGFIPFINKGGILLDIMRLTPTLNFIHLITGAAGIAVFMLGRRRYATWYCAIIGAIYLVTFSNGNVDYGNVITSFGPQDYLGRIQWITINGLHAGLMLVSWLVAALSAMQRGDRATRQYRSERRWIWETRTPTEG